MTTTPIAQGPVDREVRGRRLRRFVLWLTGRDLLEPPLPKLPEGVYWTISGPPGPRWELTFSADAYVKFNLPAGPNVLHRIAQRVAFGLRWRLIEKPSNC